jgi:DNA-binding LytR/AlgR family response regulator
MLSIAIIEDEQPQSDLLKSIASDWANSKSINFSIKCFANAESFLFAYEDVLFDLLLIDIQMDGISGIELAKKLRQKGDKSEIVFITAIRDYVFEGYDVNALHYLVKPIEQSQIYDVLDKALSIKGKEEQYILIKYKKVASNDIYYLESRNHYLYYCLIDDSTSVNISITKAMENLPGTFVQCHRSYIVNLAHTSRITKTDVVMDNGKQIPLSRNRISEVKNAFINYYKGEI